MYAFKLFLVFYISSRKCYLFLLLNYKFSKNIPWYLILNIIGKELLELYPLRTELSDLVVAVVVDCYKLLCGSHPRQPGVG